MKRIDGIVFDFGGVISQTQDARFFPEVTRLTGWTREEVLAGWARHRRLMDADAISVEALYRRIGEELGRPIDAALAKRLGRIDFDSWSIPNPETLAWARELKAAGFKVGILTNMPSAFLPWFDRCAGAFRALADAEVVSGPERMVKPNPEIYALMARRMGLAPESLFFLDATQATVDAARACGWQAARFTSVAAAKDALEAVR